MFELQTRPIDSWPRPFTKHRKRGSFTRNYHTVMSDLERELRHLRARSVLLLLALEESDIRIDGRPRAGTTPKHPGVILVVETPDKGMLRFPCDAFCDWLDNLRAISRHLDALRRIDRYGVSVSGEQYTGWARLPPPGATSNEIRSKDDVNKFLLRILGALPHGTSYEEAFRMAEIKTHPDKGGNAEDFKRVQQCREALKRAH